MNDETTTKPYQNKASWMRGLYMLLFFLFLSVAKFVAFVVIIFQFLTVIFTSEMNQQLTRFGKSLSIYHYQVLMYLTYNTEEQPFPMGDWPEHLDKQLNDE